jgi:spermidine synthase
MTKKPKQQEHQKQLPQETLWNKSLIIIYACFFLSGTAALIYEIVWMRLLTLSFGSMVFAVGAVLSSFMAGLALGNFLLGKAADRWTKPLFGYALLEAGIGITSLAVPLLLHAVERVNITHSSTTAPFMGQALVTFVLSFPVLMVPTALMGGTLPVLSKAVIKKNRDIGSFLGMLYGLNTMGGVFGVALAGLLLLPRIGLRNTTFLAVAMNLLVAVVIGMFSRSVPIPASAKQETPGKKPVEELARTGVVLLAAIGLSGLASMIYEVAWSRSLAPVIGSSIYAFNTMLLSFIFGIGLGSLIFASLFRRRTPNTTLFAYLELVIGISCFAVLLLFDRLPAVFLKMFSSLSPSVGQLFWVELTICFLVMLVPAIMFGMTLPAITHMFTKKMGKLGASVGTVYASNTLGCIVGSAGASFALIPAFGLEHTLRTAIAINAVVAVGVLLLTKRPRARDFILSACAALLLVLVFAAPKHWNRSLITVGTAPNARWLLQMAGKGSLQDVASVPELLYYKEGLNSTVGVHRDQNDLSLSINGKTDASAKGDLPTQVLTGCLPLFLHAQPETVLVIGLGSGISLATAVSFGVDCAECVEIEPAVVPASKFFVEQNRDVLSNPHAKLIVADGRHYLLSDAKKYDVITSEPSNPWMAGESNLFTKEFYEICARSLKDRGIMCQFVQGYNLTPADFKLVMSTFSSVFPHKQLWSSEFGIDYLMIGSANEIAIDPARIEDRMKGSTLSGDLRKMGISSTTDLLAHFLVGDEKWDAISPRWPINTDNLPILEFSAPRSLYLRTHIVRSDLGDEIHSMEMPLGPGVAWSQSQKVDIHLRRADLFLLGDFHKEAIMEYEAVMGLDNALCVPYIKRAEAYEDMAEKGLKVSYDAIRADLETALRLCPDSADIYLGLAVLARLEGKPEEAVAYLEEAIGIQPKEAYYEKLIGILVDDLKDRRKAEIYLARAMQAHGPSVVLLEKAGILAEARGDYQTAVAFYRKVLKIDPYGSANYRLGVVFLILDIPERAVEPLRVAVRLGPSFVQTHLALAQAYAGAMMNDKAAHEFKRALKIDPGNTMALKGLQQLKQPPKEEF